MGKKRKKKAPERFPALSKECLGELALLCLRRCEHYFGSRQNEDELNVTDEVLAEHVRTLFKDEWANVNLKKDLSSYDTTEFIHIKFLGAISLHSSDPNGLADPYIRIAYDGTVYFTGVKRNTLNPRWNEIVVIGPVKPDDHLNIELWDWDPQTFLGSVAKFKDIRSFRGLAIYIRELLKCRKGDDYLGGIQFSLREAQSRLQLFRKELTFDSEPNGTLSFYARFQCADDELPDLYCNHYFLQLHMLITAAPTIEQVCLKQIFSPTYQALLCRQATGLSIALRLICCLRALYKGIVRYSLTINATVMYDVALELSEIPLNKFEKAELRCTCSAYKALVADLLTVKAFLPQTVATRMHLMGILSLCSTFRKLGYPSVLELAEQKVNLFITRLGKRNPARLAVVKDTNNPLPSILKDLTASTNQLRMLNNVIVMSWSRHLSEVARESLQTFAVGYADVISSLANPEDALKTYQILKAFCDDFSIPILLLNRCFPEKTVQKWMESLETEAPIWLRSIAQNDLLYAQTISCSSGQLLSKSCEEFLSRLHHNLAGIYEMTSKSTEFADIYARVLCTCGLQYIAQLAALIEHQKLLTSSGYSSGFNRKVCVVLNNMASTYSLIITDLEEMVDGREVSERRQWKYLSSVNDDIFNRWTPRPILTEMRKIFETTAEEFAGRLADDVSDVVIRVCESPNSSDMTIATAALNQLLSSIFDSLKTSTYPTLFRIVVARMYQLVLDNLAEIMTNIRMEARPDRVLFASAVHSCCDVLEAFFLDEKNALPYHKVKTPKYVWIRDVVTKLIDKDPSESSVSLAGTNETRDS